STATPIECGLPAECHCLCGKAYRLRFEEMQCGRPSETPWLRGDGGNVVSRFEKCNQCAGFNLDISIQICIIGVNRQPLALPPEEACHGNPCDDRLWRGSLHLAVRSQHTALPQGPPRLMRS